MRNPKARNAPMPNKMKPAIGSTFSIIFYLSLFEETNEEWKSFKRSEIFSL
jgi:hypothetical protein